MVPRACVLGNTILLMRHLLVPTQPTIMLNDRLRPTQAVASDVALPDSATTSVTETGSLYSPSCESEYPRKQSQYLSDKVNASRESYGCPQSDNLDNNVSSKEQFVTSKMSRNGKFIEDRIVAV